MSQLPPDKVTLEDLLRLKRAERPPAEFWVQFDRELHAKQLAALMEKKPRWSFLPTRRLVRLLSLPLSAAAACALALIALHPAANEVAQATLPVGSNPKAALRPEPVKTTVAATPPAPVAEILPVERSPEVVPAALHPPAVAAAASGVRKTAPAMAHLTGSVWSAATEPASTRSLLADLALKQLPPLSDAIPASAGLESFGNARSRPAADPLAQVSAPGETRHARLLAALTDTRLVSAAEPTSVSRTRERIANRLADEGLAADDISRVGVEGPQVSFRF